MLDLNSAMEFKFNSSTINTLKCTCSHLINQLGQPPSFEQYLPRPPPMPPFPFTLSDQNSNSIIFKQSDDLQAYLDKLFYHNTTNTISSSTKTSSLNILATSLTSNSNSYIIIIIVTISVLIILLLLFIFASFIYVYLCKLKLIRKQQKTLFKSSFDLMNSGTPPTESSLTFSSTSPSNTPLSTSPTSSNHHHHHHHHHQIMHHSNSSKLNSFKQSKSSSSSSSSCSNNELLLFNLNSSSLSSISSPLNIKPQNESTNAKSVNPRLNLLQQQQSQKQLNSQQQQQQHHYESINDFDQLYFDIAENNSKSNVSSQILSASNLNFHGQSSHYPVTCCSCTLINRVNTKPHSVTCNVAVLNQQHDRRFANGQNQNQSKYYLKSLIV